ncbi:hypothetical protein DFP72DRAFT_857332 [Ephemerocybe angulata]|uniref:Uncharacterized protein n=1 Tax=Ephemerocybe angulata TaxID=980116 RepID=A0A8H6LX91_9AGAR|nr:hypothetical protein DFP72DRAFT_857332 [Tulosesus angulatus]
MTAMCAVTTRMFSPGMVRLQNVTTGAYFRRKNFSIYHGIYVSIRFGANEIPKGKLILSTQDRTASSEGSWVINTGPERTLPMMCTFEMCQRSPASAFGTRLHYTTTRYTLPPKLHPALSSTTTRNALPQPLALVFTTPPRATSYHRNFTLPFLRLPLVTISTLLTMPTKRENYNTRRAANKVLNTAKKAAHRALKRECKKFARERGGSTELAEAKEKYTIGGRCYVKWGAEWYEAEVTNITAPPGKDSEARIEYRRVTSTNRRIALYKNTKSHEEYHHSG